MRRLVFEIALVVSVIIMGLEAVSYREAVLLANVDRKRAWSLVAELRVKCEHAEVQSRLHQTP
jgi:hypothetical protein